MELHPSVTDRLGRLAPDQRAAATAPPGPVLVVAPAGSGKTTTLVARIAWLVATGVDPATIAAITFNRRAATELEERLDAALAPLDMEPGTVRVRTFHALGLEIVRDAGHAIDLADRGTLLRELVPCADAAGLAELDGAISRLKIESRVDPGAVAADEGAGPVARAFVAYATALRSRGLLDFDDLVLLALERLGADAGLRERWRARCGHLLVDEVQDVDSAQLDLALGLAAPANRIMLVGDDDQSIYGWRLADVRRVLSLDARLPGLRRIDLEVNYRCPPAVVERAVRVVARNTERFAKVIRAAPGSTGDLVLAPDAAEDPIRLGRAVSTWPDDGSTRAILARTNRELLPAVAVALASGIPFRAPRIALPLDHPGLDRALALVAETRVGAAGRAEHPLLAIGAALAALVDAEPKRQDPVRRGRPDQDGAPRATGQEASGPVATDVAEVLEALLGWAPAFSDVPTFDAAVRRAREHLASLRRDDAALTLATAHATKGLEFDHVVILAMDAARFPSAHAVTASSDPGRALEEERRLAYVAWTRARRSLTLLYDPEAPSSFLREAFSDTELGLSARG